MTDLKIPPGVTAEEAQAALDALKPEKLSPGERFYRADNASCWAPEWQTLEPSTQYYYRRAASKFLAGYVERDKIEQALAHRETIGGRSNIMEWMDWIEGYRKAHRDLSERIRKAMGDE